MVSYDKMNEKTVKICIYWQDLASEIQKKLLSVFGDNCNWDCIPISVIEINNNDPEFSNYPNKNIVIDSFLGDEGF